MLHGQAGACVYITQVLEPMMDIKDLLAQSILTMDVERNDLVMRRATVVRNRLAVIAISQLRHVRTTEGLDDWEKRIMKFDDAYPILDKSLWDMCQDAYVRACKRTYWANLDAVPYPALMTHDNGSQALVISPGQYDHHLRRGYHCADLSL
jgi:hypothetical protein